MSVPKSTTLLRSAAGPLLDLWRGRNGRSLADNVDLDEYWCLRLVDTECKSQDKTFYADYFGFPSSQCFSAETSTNMNNRKWSPEKVREIRAEENLGVTKCSIKDIEKKRLYHLLTYIYHSTNTVTSERPRKIVGNAPFPLLAQPTILRLPCIVDS